MVDGALTLFSRQGSNVTEQVGSVRDSIREAMDSGAYDNVNDGVTRITFRNETDVEAVIAAGEAEDSGDGGGGSDLTWVWAVVGSSAFLVLGYVVLRVARRRSRERNEDADALRAAEYSAVGVGSEHEQLYPDNYSSMSEHEIFLENSEHDAAPALAMSSAAMTAVESTAPVVVK